MVEIKEVKKPASQKGVPKPRSEITYPYYDLDKCIDSVKIVYDRAGGSCDRTQLAPLLGYSGVKNGGFLTRVSAAKMFGLLEESGDRLALTERAKAIISPITPAQAERAKVEAFLGVPLFNRVYEQFRGQALPAEVGLKNLLSAQYKIVPDRIVPALRVMLDSAEQAGLFKLSGNRSRMTLPITGTNDAGTVQSINSPDPPPGDRQKSPDGGGGGGGGNGDGGGHDDIDPALLGLIKNLPPAGAKLGPKRRKALTDAFAATINFLYPEDEE